MASAGSLVDLLLFHTMERYLFNLLVLRFGKEPNLAKMVIALWLWLEEIGHFDLIKIIYSSVDQTVVNAIFNETVNCLNLISENAAQPTDSDDTPVLSRLLSEPINSRFFFYNRDIVRYNVQRIMTTVCAAIFEDNRAREVDEAAINSGIRPFGEGTSAQGAAWGAAGLVVVSSGSRALTLASSSGHGESTTPQGEEQRLALNPHARPFIPAELTPQDQRTMFFTFSKGYPLEKEEILEFFTSTWGQVVEDIMIERTPPGVTPQYGRIVLRSSSIIPLVLNGQQLAKFTIRNRHLWVRVYESRRN